VWKPPRRHTKKSTSTSRQADTIPFNLRRLAARLAYVIKKEALRDPKLLKLLKLLEVLPGPKEVPKISRFSIGSAWRYDLHMGRSSSYYALEEEALHADLQHVIAAHNREIVLKAIEQRRRELVFEIAAGFWPLQNLSEKEKMKVITLAGGRLPYSEETSGSLEKVPVPISAAKKYRLHLNFGSSSDDYMPDPEIESLMAENYALQEDILAASLAEAGLLREGERLNIVFL